MKNKNVLKLLILSSAAILVACGSKGGNNVSSSSVNNSSETVSSISSIESSSEIASSSSEVKSSSSKEERSSIVETVTAIKEKVTITIEKETITATDLFNITASSYTLSTSNAGIVKVSNDGKNFVIVHGGFAVVTAKAGDKSATVELSLIDKEDSLSSIAQKLSAIKTGFNISGYYYEQGNQTNIYKTYNPNYTYDNYKEIGYGVFKDGNVYKFRGNADGSFTGIGGVVGEGTTWKKNLFKDFTVTNKYIAKNGNKFYIPHNTIGSENINPLAKAFLEQVGLSDSTNFAYINLAIGDQGEITLEFVSSVFNGSESKAAEYILADFGIAGIDDVETYLKTAEIPTVKENSVEALKAAFKKYMNSNSYRIYGADITDSDHEIFYNYYSPTQYYEYYMDDAYGYINLDGKVYNYTADKNNHVVLGEVISGISDYKEKVETAYTINDSIFNKVTYNNTQECYIYQPTSEDNALAKFLLHTCGYDLNGKDNFLKNVDEIAFLVDGDIIYVDINLGAAMSYGQIKFQFDRLNSVDMPVYIKPTEEEGQGKEYAGYYVGSGTMNVATGKYETVESTLRLETNMTGLFTFNNVQYQLKWSAKDNSSNQNQVDFLIEITSGATKGESFVGVYLYKSNPTKLQVKFNYDESITHISWNTYTLQA